MAAVSPGSVGTDTGDTDCLYELTFDCWWQLELDAVVDQELEHFQAEFIRGLILILINSDIDPVAPLSGLAVCEPAFLSPDISRHMLGLCCGGSLHQRRFTVLSEDLPTTPVPATPVFTSPLPGIMPW